VAGDAAVRSRVAGVAAAGDANRSQAHAYNREGGGESMIGG
jgi:hypothetical protein